MRDNITTGTKNIDWPALLQLPTELRDLLHDACVLEFRQGRIEKPPRQILVLGIR
ncbi:MAG: hypothetical protein NPIRA03_13710 [Nitrospirales bacterium]|nr:MAG: hypothetical protein NPIRA03_13710 [Nitrospirales bacterium]